MTGPRLLDYDPETGVRIDYIGSSDEKTYQIRTMQSAGAIQDILDLNAAKRAEGRNYYARDSEMWRAASIPIGVQYEWMTKYGVDVYNPEHADGVLKLLDDPDWRYLKTAEIMLSK